MAQSPTDKSALPAAQYYIQTIPNLRALFYFPKENMHESAHEELAYSWSMVNT